MTTEQLPFTFQVTVAFKHSIHSNFTLEQVHRIETVLGEGEYDAVAFFPLPGQEEMELHFTNGAVGEVKAPVLVARHEVADISIQLPSQLS
jgi:hypothetical protein